MSDGYWLCDYTEIMLSDNSPADLTLDPGAPGAPELPDSPVAP